MTDDVPGIRGQIKNIPMVWYVSYGSNMHADRFACYIAGGTPPGGSRQYVGCDDKSFPVADAAVELPYSLYFAGESKVWTGGLAFVEPTATAAATRGRAYLITLAQFEQIAAQESWRDEPLKLDTVLLQKFGRLTMGDGSGNYDEMIYCGEQDGYPMISFTSPDKRLPITKPAPAYLRMIAKGLKDAHRMTMRGMIEYLIDKPGIKNNYSHAELEAALAPILLQ